MKRTCGQISPQAQLHRLTALRKLTLCATEETNLLFKPGCRLPSLLTMLTLRVCHLGENDQQLPSQVRSWL